ncbi:TetR/AcrR family transcriptional regulator [Streptomyces clavuligerus]|nr:helix-turn-helix domain-containing protein [Streptomyces clavuligerus]ANW16964.1 transcriptional regulator [Streptomyces clavuligerus]AXU11493.1 TetR/AcrR family transcriptional regulator [Streptomyces clavuligerus]MBY6301312.1 helix-turn-helix transcriptional regulator [Streptomyces clavuligerus]QCS04365.1 TetR/AcrR family transcriptional regulator [Streptomyces clavuligerus]QPJ96249.1 TetR family transcriptional regulator [Streptomyces clavuligerus]
MVRLTRAQQQERTRAAVLAAAREEFTEHGYAEAKIDLIAERAELTRGAVYANFPSKRALYLAVLIDTAERQDTAGGAVLPPASTAEALGAFARSRLEGLPLAGDGPTVRQGRLHSPAGVFDEAPLRGALAQVTRLEALLLALALESGAPAAPAVGGVPGTGGGADIDGGPGAGADGPRVRRVRLAELVLRMVSGPGAPLDAVFDVGDPFDVAHACAHLAGLDLADAWNPAHLPYVTPARLCRDRWHPPEESTDLLTGRRVGFGGDGVIALLGTGRLGAAEEAVRSALPDDRVTVVVVTDDPAEAGRLVRLRVGDVTRCLRRVFPPEALPRLRLILDDRGLFAPALGLPGTDDGTEYAVRVRRGTVVARAGGRGAAHAAATAAVPAVFPGART